MQTAQSIDALAVRAHLDQLAKPPRSLGDLERLRELLALAPPERCPRTRAVLL
jgi:hypothetical protein